MEYKKYNIENYKSYLKLSNSILVMEIIMVYLPMLVYVICLFNSFGKQVEAVFYLWLLLIPALIIQMQLLIKAYICKRILGQKGNIILMQATGIAAAISSVLIIVPFMPNVMEKIWIFVLVTLLVFPLGVQLILFLISLFAVSSTKEKLKSL